MDLIYTHKEDWTLPHWLDLEVRAMSDNLDRSMDINQWCSEQCGPLGEQWGFERNVVVLPHPSGLNPVKVRLHYTVIQYSWRFKNQRDAMLFKLRWGGR